MLKSVALLLCSIFVLAACGRHGNPPISLSRVHANTVQIAKCQEDPSSCIGGFIEFRQYAGPKILQLQAGTTNRFGNPTYGIFTLCMNIGSDDAALDNIEKIVLPSESEWNDYAIKYAKQFVPTNSSTGSIQKAKGKVVKVNYTTAIVEYRFGTAIR
ncbi:MAG TPA: hypothetical protein VF803_02380 [Candidatus Paceibacterota bacterium]